MSHTYTYSVADDFPDGAVNVTKLVKEIAAAELGEDLEHITTGEGGDEDRLDLVFENELSSGDKTKLDGDTSDPAGGLIADHDNGPFVPTDIEYWLTQTAEVTIGDITGPWNVMQILQHRKDLYNDSDSPLYDAEHQPILGTGGILEDHGDKITNLENIHAKLGWHNQQVLQALYAKPKDLLIYYGWTNSFNSGVNGWDNWKVALDMSRYELVVFGAGIEDSGHGDHSNCQAIINYIKSLNPNTKLFGYVSTNQTYANFTSKTDDWDDMGVHGIFMDESGYDYGKNRGEFNDRVDYVHGKGLIAFANAWNTDHILGTANDASYPNSTYNSGAVESKLNTSDWILMESFPVNTTAYTDSTPDGYEAKAEWAARGSKLLSLRATYGVNFAGSCVIADGVSGEQDFFDFGFISALMWSLEAFGSSDTSYGSSSAKTAYLTRPNTEGLRSLWSLNPAIRNDVNDNDIYRRFVEHAQMYVDFSTSAQASGLTKE